MAGRRSTPEIERALAGVGTVSSLRQDGALAFGQQEGINAVDPASIGGLFDYDIKEGDQEALTTLGRDGAIVNDGYASEHGLKVGSTFTITSMQGTQLNLTVRAIEHSPSFDVLSLGPITISHAAFDSAFAQQRNRLTFVDGPQDAVAKALGAFPSAKVEGKDAFIDSPDGVDRHDPGGPVGAARARRDRVAVRHRQHARALDLRAHARARHAARAGHAPAPGAPDGPPRERDHGADRGGARDRRRPRARRR